MLNYFHVILSCPHQDRLIVQTHLLEAVRPSGAGVGAAHHADDQVDLHVPVLGVGDGAGLHHVPVALGSSVLAGELVTSALHLDGVGEAVREEVDGNISAEFSVHRSELLGDEASAIRTQALIVKVLESVSLYRDIKY